MRPMQADTGQKHSATSISEALRSIVGHKLDANVYLFDYRTDLTDELAETVDINLTRQVLKKSQIRQIMADVRKPKSSLVLIQTLS